MFLRVFLFDSYLERLTNFLIFFLLFWQRKFFRKLNRHIGVHGNCAPTCFPDNLLYFLVGHVQGNIAFSFFFFSLGATFQKNLQIYLSLRSLAGFAKINLLNFLFGQALQKTSHLPSLH